MKRIPIYDATAPVVCTIEAGDVATRLDQIERLHRAVTSIERTEHGLLLGFPSHLEADVRRFAVEEKACCTFWGFEVTVVDDQVHLRWDSPPTAGDLVDRLLAAFEGDEPITALSGLL